MTESVRLTDAAGRSSTVDVPSKLWPQAGAPFVAACMAERAGDVSSWPVLFTCNKDGAHGVVFSDGTTEYDFGGY